MTPGRRRLRKARDVIAEKVASLYAEIGAKTEGLQEGLKQAKAGLVGSGQAFQELASIATKAFAMIGAEAVILKQVFDFGAQGAQILQVRSAFESLMDSVGAGPSIMRELQEATQGTVSDLELMANTNKLLTGTSGDLQRALADNLPQIWAIANAAADMNPQLGTAADMFNMITSAIQSGRVVSLAQIGLAIKTSDAYDEMGNALDKTGKALSKSEQQQAALNAVLEKGATIVAQAGSVNDEAADSIDRMYTAMTNATNAAKAQFAPAIADAADAVFYMLTASNQVEDALRSHLDAILKTSASYEEYRTEAERAIKAAGAVGQYFMVASESTYLLAQNAKLAAGMTLNLSGGLSMLGEVAQTAAGAVEEGATSMDVFAQRAGGLAQVIGEGTENLREMEISAAGLAAGLAGDIGAAMEDYSVTMSDLVTEQADLTAQLEDALTRGWSPTGEKVMGLNTALSENALKQQEAAAAIAEATAQMIYQQASAGLDTQAALNLASAMGLLSEADYAVATVVATLRSEFDSNADGMINAAEGASQYAASINILNKAVASLQTKGVPVTVDNIAKEMEQLEKAAASGNAEDTVSALSSAAPGLDELAANMEGLGTNAENALEPTAEVGVNVEEVRAAASNAYPQVDNLRGSLERIRSPMATAAQLAQTLATNLGKIPASKNISIKTDVGSFQTAITWLGNLTNAINAIPASRTVNITLQTSGGGTAPTSGIPPGIGRSVGPGFGGAVPPSTEQALQYSVTNNIYNPLAAAILAEQQAQVIRQKFGALM